ncbi:Rap1a/Tai family immunity protein [Massilia sp. W12]|uniref:Rap1a/Tai family immunity protein n=1 Tax=Massilia sp. W12 TaxID=3126507 RepID=UPI0030D2B36D
MPVFLKASLSLLTLCLVSQTLCASEMTFGDSNLVNVSGKTFFSALRSKDKTTQERAQLYMTGVWDASEGKSWCSFTMFKSGTLQEIVYRHFSKLPSERLEERAAKLIEEALSSRHPCKVKK